MSDRRRPRRPKYNSLVAAAELMLAPNRALKGSVEKAQGWQIEAWNFYDTVGELRFGVQWIANAMSRVNLVAAAPPSGAGDEPTIISPDTEGFTAAQYRAAEIVQTISGGASGQGQMLAAFAIHLSVSGIGWLVAEPDLNDPEADSFETWQVYSSDEIRMGPTGIEIAVGHREWREVHPNAIVIKVWRPHPRKSWEADAPTHGVLGVLREIELLQKHIQASAQSRLAGAGLLAIPSEAVFPPGQGPQSTIEDIEPEDQNTRPADDTFVETLIDAMTTPIADRGSAAAVVPLVVKIPGDYVDKVKHLTFATPFDSQVLALMESAITRLSLGMDIPPEVLTGKGASNHWCHPINYKARTLDGWKDGNEIQIGDMIATINPNSGIVEYQPVRDIYRAEVVEEPMLSVNMHGARRGEMDVLMTPGHRNIVIRDGQRTIVQATELEPGDIIPMSAVGAEFPFEPKYSDAFVKLIAWYSADGTLTNQNGKPGQIRIGKSWKRNPTSVEKLFAILTDVFGPAQESMSKSDVPMWRIEMQERGMAMAVLNSAARDMILAVVPGFDKVIPAWFVDHLTEAQTHLFLQAWLDSDGTTSHGVSKFTIGQSNPDRLNAIELAGIRAGYSVRRFTTEKNRQSGRFSEKPMFSVRLGLQNYRTVRSITEGDYSGDIWCPTTENGTWLAQEPDTGWAYFTGNSAWQVQEESITLHIEPLSETVCNALTIGYLKAALEAEGYDPDEAMVWYDTTDLKVRPDKSRGAIEAYDRNQLSGEALLRELGLNLDDLPSMEEKKEAVLLSVARGAPTLAPIMLAELGYISADLAEQASMPQGEISQPSSIEIGQGPPSTRPESVADSLLAACDVIVHRALERAGTRLKSAAGKNVKGGAAAIPCDNPAKLHCTLTASQYAEIDYLLADAWGLIPVIADRYGINASKLTLTLDQYVRNLIASGDEHSFERLRETFIAEASR